MVNRWAGGKHVDNLRISGETPLQALTLAFRHLLALTEAHVRTEYV